MVNVTNGKIIRLLVDDEPFDVRYGELRKHERTRLRAESCAAMPNGSRRRDRVRVTSERLVSLEHRSVAAILYEVEPLEAAARFVVQSELVANEPLPGAVEKDLAGAGVGAALVTELFDDREERVVLAHRTAASRLLMAAGMDHVIDAVREPRRPPRPRRTWAA